MSMQQNQKRERKRQPNKQHTNDITNIGFAFKTIYVGATFCPSKLNSNQCNSHKARGIAGLINQASLVFLRIVRIVPGSECEQTSEAWAKTQSQRRRHKPSGGSERDLGGVCVLGFKCKRSTNEMILVRESMICYKRINMSFYIGRTIPFPCKCYVPIGGQD